MGPIQWRVKVNEAPAECYCLESCRREFIVWDEGVFGTAASTAVAAAALLHIAWFGHPQVEILRGRARSLDAADEIIEGRGGGGLMRRWIPSSGFEEIIVCIFDIVSAHRQCPPLFTSSVNGRKLGQNGGFPLQSPINGGDFATGQHELTQIGLWRLRQWFRLKLLYILRMINIRSWISKALALEGRFLVLRRERSNTRN
nr:hypothetical protein Iba_chr02cCG7320 [Ipomoea batatas]